jgi:hypothetical protein
VRPSFKNLDLVKRFYNALIIAVPCVWPAPRTRAVMFGAEDLCFDDIGLRALYEGDYLVTFGLWDSKNI